MREASPFFEFGIAAAVVVMAVGAARAADVPEPFRAWGTKAPESKPLPAGWTEVQAPFKAPSPTADELRAGFIVLIASRGPGEPRRLDRLDACAARGQYIPLTFTLCALDDLKDLEINARSLASACGGGTAMGFDEIGKLDPVVDLLSTNRFTPEIARRLVGRGKPWGLYNGAGHTKRGDASLYDRSISLPDRPLGEGSVPSFRNFFGFYGFKTGAQQIFQWCYHFSDSPFKGDGFRDPDEGYVYLAPDGPLPSVMWEAVREGIDDYRHAQFLHQLIAAAKSSPDPASPGRSPTSPGRSPAAKAAAASAQKTLREILGRIDPDGSGALDRRRASAPPDAETLDAWRRKVADEIVRLREALGADVQNLPAPPPVSPFDFPWAEGPEKP